MNIDTNNNVNSIVKPSNKSKSKKTKKFLEQNFFFEQNI